MTRFLICLLVALPLGAEPGSAAPPNLAPGTANPAFRSFLESLWPRAVAAGISRATFDAALRFVAKPDPKVLARAGAQSEFSRSIPAYLADAASPQRVAQGRALAAKWSSVLAETERNYGVPGEIVLAVWGLESSYGASSGDFSVLRALASLAFRGGDRGEKFRDEFIAALRILEHEHLQPAALTGSWAGALGQTQFMPSSFLADAVDGDHDGRRDIWNSVPDILTSIGHFLAQNGWRRDLAWGWEVVLPPGLDLKIYRRSLAEWRSLGVRPANGRGLAGTGEASLFFPAGIAGPAFLLTDNFEALRAYNTSDSYALGVGLLADRIAGGGALVRPWPKERALTMDERREIHRRLAALGLYDGTPDGKFGAKTRDAVRRFQLERGLVPDGYAGPKLLETLTH